MQDFTCNTLAMLVSFFREGELERDEKFVQGLMHDLQNGGLRRRRGGGLEMGDWDSDDDDEGAEDRRRLWELKREELKRRMLEDENLGKLGIKFYYPETDVQLLIQKRKHF